MISYPFLLYSLLHKIRKGSFSSDFNHKRFKFQYLFRNTFFLFYFFFKSSGETNLYSLSLGRTLSGTLKDTC